MENKIQHEDKETPGILFIKISKKTNMLLKFD